MARKSDKDQVVMDFDTHIWPAQELFPINIKSDKRTVQKILYNDIEQSANYIIVTGFTSLSNLIDLFGKKDFDNHKKVRILIGFEPNLVGRKKYVRLELDKEIKDFWLKEGLSIMQGGAVIHLIEKIKCGKIEFRFRNKLHAKIYVGDSFAMLGSSNFSYNGLNIQEEANIRVENDKDNFYSQRQYNDIKQIADSYYQDASDYNSKIIALLKDLIKEVDWKEALARAIAEILEGNWLDEYKEIISNIQQTNLWPTQWKGLAQGVSILQNQSNVLIADPTGAGKTKLCTAIILSLQHWLFEIGKNYRTESLIICPPLVVDKWGDEFKAFRRIGHSQRSMGILSTPNSKKHKDVIEELNIANILTIDEAHNYLSPDTHRTHLIKDNKADFKILITATPISKKVEDLLHLIELLDVDNLSDEDFTTFQELKAKPKLKAHDTEQVEMLRRFISKFTVRRTKKKLNKEIDKEPAKYVNRLDEICRFPEQHEKTYTTQETEKDIVIVKEINELVKTLKGITYLTSFNLPSYEINKEESLETYIKRRITSAKALSIYMVRAALRSSHVALVEHIEGTKAAEDFFGFRGKSNVSGDKLKKIQDIIQSSKLPSRNKKFLETFFPPWLNDKDLYITACNKDYEIYKKISELAKKLSGKRELGKVKELIKTSKDHADILAFDSTVITLYYLKKLFEVNYPNQKVLVASGSDKDKESSKILDIFKLDSIEKGKYIALCSDKMSESVDLQKASCVFLLDMPSVLRIVEQRIGRVDRMDSMHKDIDIYWPDDTEEYALNADQRIIDTNNMVEQIYGSNFNVPDNLKGPSFTKTDSTDAMINEYKEFVDKDESWAGIHDSFQSIIDLKEGDKPLIDEETYNQFTNVSSEVKTRVSFVSCPEDWCFVALKGEKSKSPRWYFIDSKNNIHTDYPDVCSHLRQNITTESEGLKWDDKALEKYIKLFKAKERELLPPKKKRALDVAEYILDKKLKIKDINNDTKDEYNRILKIMKLKSNKAVDFERLAEEWIVILQPYLKIKRDKLRRKKTVLNYYSLKSEYKNIQLDKETISKIAKVSIIADEIDKRIAACIIGVGNKSEET
ncbi:SNF2-related protein [Flavobacterium terrisoli]|uniref:SNF2-related protein n=1 Tax=Flavobacterium terrisoli TaxID=3242195 RepID=UPI0025436512|nr:SNF2-related protein [Flavobacterium buctense]